MPLLQSSAAQSSRGQAPILSACPPAIEQICTPNNNKWVKFAVWSKDANLPTVFSEWWEQTKWRQEHRKVQVTWDTSKLSAEAWKFFRCLARSDDGIPVVQCLRCDYTLSHPAIEQSGTSMLRRHVERKQCKHASLTKGLESITGFLTRQKVYLLQYWLQ